MEQISGLDKIGKNLHEMNLETAQANSGANDGNSGTTESESDDNKSSSIKEQDTKVRKKRGPNSRSY